jgi:hypothetical protein
MLPANVKIDGKATEWNNGLQAYNKSTNIFYTIANNKDILYLIIQAKETDIIKKIIGGGVVFSIDKTGTKSDKHNISITFPILNDGDKIAITAPFNELKAQSGSSDSLLRAMNTNLSARAKEIGIEGIKGLPDSLISVYNEDGIKAVALFDDKGILTYELAISLKQLDMPANGLTKFNYRIRVNGITSSHKPIIHQTPDGPITVTTTLRVLNTSNSNFEFMNTPTDFWGEYTLAVKK